MELGLYDRAKKVFLGSVEFAFISYPYTRLSCTWPPAGSQAGGELTLDESLEFTVYTTDRAAPYTLRVPEGFKTDLASDPLDRRGRWDYGAVVHDYLYSNKGVVPNYNDTEIFNYSRLDADTIFYHIMDQCNPFDALGYTFYYLKNFITFATVRLFGWIYWND